MSDTRWLRIAGPTATDATGARCRPQFQSGDCEPYYVLFEDFTHVKFYRRSLCDVCVLVGATFDGFVHVDDGGESWHLATLERDVDDRWACVRWWIDWQPPGAGEFVLCCRATDESGETQPLEPEWNIGGYENNAVQRLPVVVR